MRLIQLLACCVLVLCIGKGTALRCRTGEHQKNDRFQNVMQRCRARLLQGMQNTGDENSSEDDSADTDGNYDESSSDSIEASRDKKLMNGRIGTTDSNHPRNWGSNDNGDQKNDPRKYGQNLGSPRPYPYNGMKNSSSRGDTTNNRNPRNMTSQGGGYNGKANYGQKGMTRNQHDQACVIQCFFEGLNLVDQKGFPEKSAVTKIMIENIRDPELQDFIEEAVMDCFYLIDADKNIEGCKFSQSLLNCLATKGRERCEDWDDQ